MTETREPILVKPEIAEIIKPTAHADTENVSYQSLQLERPLEAANLNLNKSFSIKQWKQGEKIIFLHIPKTGGTSIDEMLYKRLNPRGLKPVISGSFTRVGAPEPANLTYIGKRHFDWSWIEENYPENHVITVFRDPTERAFSHFNYMKTQTWTKRKAMREQQMTDLLQGLVLAYRISFIG